MTMTRMRRARQCLGLSQSQLAAMIGTAQSDISRWETGYARPYPVQARRLPEALGVAPEDLQAEVADQVKLLLAELDRLARRRYRRFQQPGDPVRMREIVQELRQMEGRDAAGRGQ